MKKVLPVLLVTQGNTDGSIVAGDRVSFSPDGSLNLIHSRQGGWMSKDELAPVITDFKYEIDSEYQWIVTDRRQYARRKTNE